MTAAPRHPLRRGTWSIEEIADEIARGGGAPRATPETIEAVRRDLEGDWRPTVRSRVLLGPETAERLAALRDPAPTWRDIARETVAGVAFLAVVAGLPVLVAGWL